MKAVFMGDFIVNKAVWTAMKRSGGSANTLANELRETNGQKTRATSVYQWLASNSVPLAAIQGIQTLYPDIERPDFKKMIVVSMVERDLKL